MKIVFVAYHYQSAFHSPDKWIEFIRPLNEVMEALAVNHSVVYAGQINYTGEYLHHGVQYLFLPSAKKKSRFPLHLHKTIQKQQPDVVVVLGLHFPIQVTQLRWYAGKKAVILARHHADRPAKGIKKLLLRIADRNIDGYLFTSMGNAAEWLETGIISNRKKIYEILAGSSCFSRRDKEQSRQRTGMREGPNFVWVGRLDVNKDPLTVLAGFEKYFSVNQEARLHMIFQDDKQLGPVKQRIQESAWLKGRVVLAGQIEHAELEYWYSAADYFVSGSHREGGSYALTEAMACGCIPVVTNIPPAMKVIDNGKAGYYYTAGDADDLYRVLLTLDKETKTAMSDKVEEYFSQNLSPAAIADRLYAIYSELR